MANVYPTRPARLDFGGNGARGPSIDPLRKGSTFRRRVQVENLDLTGLEIRMSVKEDYEDTAELFFSTENTAPNPTIEIDGVDGAYFDLLMPASETANVDAGAEDVWPRRKRYVYDLELVDGTEVYAFLYGEFWVVDEITIES